MHLCRHASIQTYTHTSNPNKKCQLCTAWCGILVEHHFLHTHTHKISSFTSSTEDHKHVEEQAAKLSLFTSVKKICNSKWRLMAKELEHHLSNYANKIPRQNYLGSAHGSSQRRVLKSLATSDSDPALTWQSFITHMTAEYSQPSPSPLCSLSQR